MCKVRLQLLLNSPTDLAGINKVSYDESLQLKGEFGDWPINFNEVCMSVL